MRGVAPAVCALAVCAGLAGCGGSHHATSLPGLTAAKLARLKATVRSTAAADGDAQPSSVMVYATRRHEANIAAGAGTGVFGRTPVYLVIIRGHFVCDSCSGPAGSAAPTGDVVTLVVSRKTLLGLDGGIGGQTDTSGVGPGLPLPLS
jgi:hypothetical protein